MAGSNDAAAVVRLGVWQLAQPALTNWFEPSVSSFAVMVVSPIVKGAVAGAAAFESRTASAKLSVSDDTSDTVLSPLPPRLVMSSGVGLRPRQPCVLPAPPERSLGKPSLVTPCSTL